MSAPPQRIRLLLADDHAVVRAGLRSFLERQRDMAVVGEAASARELVQRVHETSPDVVVTDLRMPGNVVEAIAAISTGTPSVRVLVFSGFDDAADAARAFEAGAVGYVLKQSPERELVAAIRRVAAGGRFVDAELAARVIEEVGMPGAAAPAGPAVQLTEREYRVLDLIARGYTGPQIARELGVRVGTVESFRHRIRKKLGLRSRAEVTEFVRVHGHRWRPMDSRRQR